MRNSDLYYQYYDALHKDKDYKKETDLILSQTRRQGISHPKKILEIGCGTGNFTFLIGKKTSNLTAIDIDPKMVEIARKKLARIVLPSVRFLTLPIEKLKERNFDLALALFNIVTYIPDERRLKSFMKGVYERLLPGGVFIFDFWNGIAAILDPPKKKKIAVKERRKKINSILTPKTDFLNQKVVLTYALTVAENKKITKGVFSFDQILWTPWQIKSAVQEAGFKIANSFPLMKPNKPITEKDWKVMFVCKK